MKKLICVVSILAMVLLAGTAFAGTKTLTFAWGQTLSTDFAGWKLYRATIAGGPYTLMTTINYTGTPQTEYTSPQSLVSPDGQQVTYYFTLTAFDQAANESARSNEVSAVIDFLAPGVPIQLKVTVTTP
jgi:hypothetical protein